MALWSLYRKPFTCNVCQKKFTGTRNNFTGARRTLTTLYRTSCNIAVWVPACIVWLYYASSLTVWWFSDHFFLLSVWSPWKKKFKYFVQVTYLSQVHEDPSRWDSPSDGILRALTNPAPKLIAAASVHRSRSPFFFASSWQSRGGPSWQWSDWSTDGAWNACVRVYVLVCMRDSLDFMVQVLLGYSNI